MGRLLRLLGVLSFLVVWAPVWAQEGYPTKLVRIVVTFSPGGMPDAYGRLLATELARVWQQPVTVENRLGGGGIIGTDYVAKSPPDGYTLLFTIDAPIVMAASMRANLPYEPQKDLVPIINVVSTPYVLMVTPSLPASSLAELITLARAKPGTLAFASSGTGTPHHLSGELLKSKAEIDIVHVPYKGVGQSMPDVIAGRVAMAFGGITPSIPLVRSAKLRAIAITSKSRMAALPDVPTFAEAGLAGIEVGTWVGLMGPAGTPPAVIRKVHDDVLAIVRKPDFQERVMRDGLEVLGSTPQEFKQKIQADIDEWGAIIKRLGIKAE